MHKRGELTSGQIAKIVLAIAGFVIALFFLFFILDLKDFSSDEICRLSILTRATTPDEVERYAPIKCTTKKICLTEGEDCDQFIGETKNLADPIDLPRGQDEKRGKSNAAVKIEETVAKSMLDCWKMMGEGKMDLFGGSDMGPLNLIDANHLIRKETSCIICSRLAIADDVDPEILKEIDLNNYLEKEKVPNSEDGHTYIEEFTDRQVRAYPRDFEADLEENATTYTPTREIAVLFMQINTEATATEAGLSTGLKSAAFVFGTTTKGLGPLGVLSIKPASILSSIVGVGTGLIAGFQTYESRNIAAGYCGEFTSTEQKRNGCSVLTTFDYNQVDKINDYCWILEGYP
ncbi:MAG: hypothetical protein ABIH92_03870 [Nanoarchaeota archaeon]